MTLVKKFQNGNGESRSFPDLLENFFDKSFPSLFSGTFNMNVPAVNISETNDQYHLELAAPGLTRENFKLNLEGNTLEISANKTDDNKQEKGNYTRREFNHQSFTRLFTLPETVQADGIEAEYVNGMLSVILPKKDEAKRQPRQIQIK